MTVPRDWGSGGPGVEKKSEKANRSQESERGVLGCASKGVRGLAAGGEANGRGGVVGSRAGERRGLGGGAHAIDAPLPAAGRVEGVAGRGPGEGEGGQSVSSAERRGPAARCSAFKKRAGRQVGRRGRLPCRAAGSSALRKQQGREEGRKLRRAARAHACACRDARRT